MSARERGLSSERDAFDETEQEKVLENLRNTIKMQQYYQLFILNHSYNWKFEVNLASNFFIQFSLMIDKHHIVKAVLRNKANNAKLYT